MALFYSPVGNIEPDALNVSLKQLLECQHKRMDGRTISEVRKTSIHTSLNPLPVVTLTHGGSMVAVGLKAELGPCDHATPNRGRLSVEVTVPLVGSSVSMEQQLDGRRCLGAFVLGVLESCTDSRSWCIREGEACWQIYVDVVVLSIDGGLRDLAVHGSRIALSMLRLPRTMLPDGTMAEAASPRMLSIPYALTFGLFTNQGSSIVLLADPTMAEENAADAICTVIVDATKPNSILSVVHHGGVALAPVTIIEALVITSKNIVKDEMQTLKV